MKCARACLPAGPRTCFAAFVPPCPQQLVVVPFPSLAGFTLAYAHKQLAAEAEVLQFFAPLTDVEAVLEGRMPRDNNNRYLVSTLAGGCPTASWCT